MLYRNSDISNPILSVKQPRFVLAFAKYLSYTLIFTLFSLLFLPWQQTAVGYGKLTALSREDREQLLEAPISGKIIKWHVQEGDYIKKDTLIVDLDDNALEILNRMDDEKKALDVELQANLSSITSIEGQIKALEEVKVLSLKAADSDIKGGQQNIKAAQSELSAAEAEFNLDQKNSNRRQKLQVQGLSSDRDLEVAEFKASKSNTEIFKAKAKLEKAKSELLSKQADREKKSADMDAKILKEKVNIEKLKAEIAKINGKKAQLDIKIQRQNAQKIFANRNGWISRIYTNQNEQVKAGDILAVFLPETEQKAVELWIKGNDAPLVVPQRHVRLQFEGWPAVQFSGWPSVAVGTFGGEVVFVDYMANSKGQFRVIIKPTPEQPWPDTKYLRQGARVNAWILLDQVSLGYELWRLLNGFPPSSKQNQDENDPYQKKKKEKEKDDKDEKDDKGEDK